MTQTFNLSEALNGKQVVTRTGIKVTIICVSGGKILGKVHDPSTLSSRWEAEKWNLDGKKFTGSEHHHDLFMVA